MPAASILRAAATATTSATAVGDVDGGVAFAAAATGGAPQHQHEVPCSKPPLLEAMDLRGFRTSSSAFDDDHDEELPRPQHQHESHAVPLESAADAFAYQSHFDGVSSTVPLPGKRAMDGGKPSPMKEHHEHVEEEGEEGSDDSVTSFGSGRTFGGARSSASGSSDGAASAHHVAAVLLQHQPQQQQPFGLDPSAPAFVPRGNSRATPPQSAVQHQEQQQSFSVRLPHGHGWHSSAASPSPAHYPVSPQTQTSQFVATPCLSASAPAVASSATPMPTTGASSGGLFPADVAVPVGADVVADVAASTVARSTTLRQSHSHQPAAFTVELPAGSSAGSSVLHGRGNNNSRRVGSGSNVGRRHGGRAAHRDIGCPPFANSGVSATTTSDVSAAKVIAEYSLALASEERGAALNTMYAPVDLGSFAATAASTQTSVADADYLSFRRVWELPGVSTPTSLSTVCAAPPVTSATADEVALWQAPDRAAGLLSTAGLARTLVIGQVPYHLDATAIGKLLATAVGHAVDGGVLRVLSALTAVRPHERVKRSQPAASAASMATGGAGRRRHAGGQQQTANSLQRRCGLWFVEVSDPVVVHALLSLHRRILVADSVFVVAQDAAAAARMRSWTQARDAFVQALMQEVPSVRQTAHSRFHKGLGAITVEISTCAGNNAPAAGAMMMPHAMVAGGSDAATHYSWDSRPSDYGVRRGEAPSSAAQPPLALL